MRGGKISAMKNNSNLWVVLGGIYTIVLIAVVNSPLNDLLLVPVIFRKINIPVAAWSLIGLYIAVIYYFKGRVKDDAHFFAYSIAFGWLTLQYLLYLRIFKAVCNSPLGKGYILYIAFLFMAITFLISIWGLYTIRSMKSGSANPFLKPYFFPATLLPVWALMYLFYNKLYLVGIMAAFAVGLSLIVFRTGFMPRLAGFLKEIHSDKRKFILFIFIISFMFRFAFSVNIILKTEFPSPKGGYGYTGASDDGPTYDTHGKLLANDFGTLFRSGIITPSSWEPGYGIFLGIIYKVFGHNYFVVGLFQAILGALLVLLCFDIARRVFDYKTAIISSYLLALNQNLIFIFGALHVEVVYIFLIYLSLWLIIRAVEMRRPWVAIAIAGLTLGLAVITRGVILLFPFFIFLWMIGKSFGGSKIYANPYKSFGVFFSCFMTVIIAMCYINYLNVGKFILTSKGEAYLNASGAADYHYAQGVSSPGNMLFSKRGFDLSKPIELSKEIISHPVSFIKTYCEVVSVRMGYFFFWHPHGFFCPIMLYNCSNPFTETMLFYSILMALIGVIWILCRPTIDRIFLLSFILYYSLLHSTVGFVMTARYRAPVIPVLIMLVSYALALGLSRIEAHKKR